MDNTLHKSLCTNTLPWRSHASVAAGCERLRARWWLAGTDPELRARVLDDACDLARRHPEHNSIVSVFETMASSPGLLPETRGRLTATVGDVLKGASARRLTRWMHDEWISPGVAVKVGEPFPELRFTSKDGREIDMARLKGKVVLVDFWASWCGPCKAEMPHLVKAYAACHDKGFEIIGISLDQDRAAMNRYLEEKKIIWPQYFDGKGWDNAIARRFHMKSIPRCYLVDREGIVRYDRALGAELQATVERLCGMATAR